MSIGNSDYKGSFLFLPLADFIKIPIDQLNFFICQLVTIFIAQPLQCYLPAQKLNIIQRHLVHLSLGLIMAYFTLGSEIWYLFIDAGIGLLLLRLTPLKRKPHVMVAFFFLFLSMCHFIFMFNNYGSNQVNLIGRLMLMTMRLSSLTFNLADGEEERRTGKPLDNRNHHVHAVRVFPTLLEYFSYMFYFQGFLAGPFIFFNDYKCYIDGNYEHYCRSEAEVKHLQANKHDIIFPKKLIRTTAIYSVIHVLLMIILSKRLSLEFIADPRFDEWSFLRKCLYIYVASIVAHNKYYLAFGISTLSHLVSGIGFSGFHEHNGQLQPLYDVSDNCHLWICEFGSSLKVRVDAWNIRATIWLREVVYDRSPRHVNMLLTYGVSCIWHGFYPGYYLAYGVMFVATVVARAVRRTVRPHFQGTWYMSSFYDVLTACGAGALVAFNTGTFILLDWTRTWKYFESTYFAVPLALLLLYLLTIVMTMCSGKKPHTAKSAAEPKKVM